jgi:hypothetical protein
MRRNARLPLLLLAAVSAVPAIGWAGGTAPAGLAVSAEVRPSGVFRVETRRALIEVSEADVERGFVEIAAGSMLKLETGRFRPEVVVDFSPESGPFKSVEMRTDTGWLAAGADFGGGLRLDPSLLDELPPAGAIRKDVSGGVAATNPGASVEAARRGIVAAVSYRFLLGDKAVPGTYRVPLVVNIGL